MMRALLVSILVVVQHLTAAPQNTVLPAQAAWETLDKALQHGDSDERRQALAALATVEATNEEAVRRVEDALHDKGPLVRQTAALALGQMKARQAIPALKESLGDDDEVAFAAAKSLTDMGETSGRDMLVAVITGDRKDSPGIASRAMRDAKGRLKHPTGLILTGAQNAAGAMYGPGPSLGIRAAKDAVDLSAKGVPGRAAAAAYLAKDPEPYAITLLEWALGDDNQFVRLEAAKGLGQRGNAASVPKLQALLNDSHDKVRTMAAASMIRLISKSGSLSQNTAHN